MCEKVHKSCIFETFIHNITLTDRQKITNKFDMDRLTTPIPPTALSKHVFFPAAALFAVINPWLLLLSYLASHGITIDPSIHAKSMLFGYVGALIAGYLTGKLTPVILSLLFGLWLVSRFIEIFGSELLWLNLTYSAFGVLLSILVVPKFKAAKKWCNRAIGPLIACIGCFPLISWLLSSWSVHINLSLHSFILLISLLMFFMGGRFIVPAITRAYADKNRKVPHRVQPHIEGITMVLFAIAVVFSLNPLTKQWIWIFSGPAAILILLRLYRWKLFALNWRRSADIWALGSGYAWLGIGLLAFSISLEMKQSVVSSIHLITIAGLGILSSTIMLKVFVKAQQVPVRFYFLTITLLSIAALSRFLIDFVPQYRQVMLALAALTWSFSYIAVLTCMLAQLIFYKAGLKKDQ